MSEQREHILTCACELYLEDGLEGFSMRKLARDVGVTAPALYRYYWDTIEACVPPARIMASMAGAGFSAVARRVQLGIFSEYRASVA